MVKDKADNTNNRFGVGSELNRRLTGGPFPFWGVPPKDTLTTLQPKKTREHGPDDLPEFRHADVAAKGRGTRSGSSITTARSAARRSWASRPRAG
jgi:hypothetical protein